MGKHYPVILVFAPVKQHPTMAAPFLPALPAPDSLQPGMPFTVVIDTVFQTLGKFMLAEYFGKL
jgi:hypothetical protein